MTGIVVTGALGNVGSAVADSLTGSGHDVMVAGQDVDELGRPPRSIDAHVADHLALTFGHGLLGGASTHPRPE